MMVEYSERDLMQVCLTCKTGFRSQPFITNRGDRMLYQICHKCHMVRLGARSGYVRVAEKRIGRRLYLEEVVHHLDCDRKNNTPENLCVMQSRVHSHVHFELGKVGMREAMNGEVDKVLSYVKDINLRRIIALIYKDKVPILHAMWVDG